MCNGRAIYLKCINISLFNWKNLNIKIYLPQAPVVPEVIMHMSLPEFPVHWEFDVHGPEGITIILDHIL